MIDELKADLIRDEGVRLKPYRDSVGKLTIGVGRNLDDKGITNAEAFILMGHDIDEVVTDLDSRIPWWVVLPPNCRRGLANMAFNLGVPRLLGFKRMLAALERGDFDDAATEALDSQWERQVGARADRIAELFRKGV